MSVEANTLNYTDQGNPGNKLCAQTTSQEKPASSVGVLDLGAGYVKVDAYDHDRNPVEDDIMLTLSGRRIFPCVYLLVIIWKVNGDNGSSLDIFDLSTTLTDV